MVDTLFTPVQETFKMPEKSDLDDLVTIFDISRSTMEIRKVEYQINRKNQEQVLTLLQHVNQLSKKLYDNINRQSDVNGQLLLKDSNDLMEFFYSREVPCTEKCDVLNDLTKKVKTENMDFETLVRSSNSLGSVKVTVEKLYQKILRIEQRLTVKNVIVGGSNLLLDDEDEDED
jgi:mevalonate kinase